MQTELLSVDGESIPYRIVCGASRRRHLAIRVNFDATVDVLLPPGSPAHSAEEAVRRRADWILGHVRRLRALATGPLRGVAGENHPFLGQNYRLELVPARSWQGVRLAPGRMVVSARDTSPEGVLRCLDLWYLAEARRVFAERLSALLPCVSWLTALPALRVRRLRRRWGSCSPTGVLTLNSHLVKAPEACIDYVIFHEIAHLRELNHSPRFYAELATLLPDWKSRRQTLQNLSPLLLPC